MPRIVSLLPSSTEIADALGFRDRLVGRSHECDFPAGIGSLPILTSPKFNPKGSSLQIDKEVRQILRYGLSVYQLDVEQLEELKPDYIITQSQCEVCAVNMKDVEAAVCQLISSNPTIINLEPNSLRDVLDDVDKVGEALDVKGRAQELVSSMQSVFAKIRDITSGLNRPRIACIEWLSPIMLAGNWVPELVEIAGGENVLAAKDQHSHYFKWEEIRLEDPEVIAVMPCGFDIDRTMEEIGLLTDLPGWDELKAVKNDRVFVTDGNQYFNRPGPRIKDSAEILAEILHPEVFEKQHLGKGYVPLERVLK
ncbi:cobalamin-binding protein [Fulvivirga sp. M361]|uniref:cobalamin-binding protein n=1 Tax=Fulvivirga sp. M361 TaxID=2594266 RepID=UPI00117B9A4E|nr:cobalamin-binding protein [Fulvivirga sp. M361]TRX55531.1 cobalamin-binding protein [Fulvivirga sp. M361]